MSKIRIVREEKGFLNVDIDQGDHLLSITCSCGRNGDFWEIKYYYNNKSPHFDQEELEFKSIRKLKKWISEVYGGDIDV